MEQPQTSFIPKRSLVDDAVPMRASSGSNLFMFLAIIVFFGALLSTGGVYFYSIYLNKNIVSMEESLIRARGQFEPALVSTLQKLDKRLLAGNEVLSNHTLVSPIFTSLESITLKSVRFNKFAYTFTKDKTTKAEIKMSGLARGYTAIALQAEMFKTNKYIQDVVFSNLNLDDKGNVSFDLSFSMDPHFLLYKTKEEATL